VDDLDKVEVVTTAFTASEQTKEVDPGLATMSRTATRNKWTFATGDLIAMMSFK
jgi:hypothetical protein